jgi:hypothetical protein
LAHRLLRQLVVHLLLQMLGLSSLCVFEVSPLPVFLQSMLETLPGVLLRVRGVLVYLGEGFVPNTLGRIVLGLLAMRRFEEPVWEQHYLARIEELAGSESINLTL